MLMSCCSRLRDVPSPVDYKTRGDSLCVGMVGRPHRHHAPAVHATIVAAVSCLPHKTMLVSCALGDVDEVAEYVSDVPVWRSGYWRSAQIHVSWGLRVFGRVGVRAPPFARPVAASRRRHGRRTCELAARRSGGGVATAAHARPASDLDIRITGVRWVADRWLIDATLQWRGAAPEETGARHLVVGLKSQKCSDCSPLRCRMAR